MKVFFDTNVYVAEAFLGKAAQAILGATSDAGWRTYTSEHVLDEVEDIMRRTGYSGRFATKTRERVARRATLVEPSPSRHGVPDDAQDSPVLRAALAAGSDYLVTNDKHLLKLDPYEGLRIVSMTQYHRLLVDAGLLARHGG